jgi:hypothetical protein
MRFCLRDLFVFSLLVCVYASRDDPLCDGGVLYTKRTYLRFELYILQNSKKILIVISVLV